jgi:hypothetical protein
MQHQIKKNWVYYLTGCAIFLLVLIEAKGHQDFSIFYAASKDLIAGKNIYTIQYHEWYHYYYSILFALILVPFTCLPLYFAGLLFLLLNVFFVYRIWQILKSWLPLQILTAKTQTLLTILSFIFILSFLRDNFHFGQVTILILYLTIEGLHFIARNQIVFGSFLVALGIDIKLLPLVFLPYLIYRKEGKAFLFIVGFLLVFLILPGLVIGFEYNKMLLLERWVLINPMNKAHILDTSERSFHSLTTLLSTLLVQNSGDTYALPLKRNIADLTLSQLNAIINLARLLLICMTFYFLQSRPFVAARSTYQKLYEVAYLCLIVPLIFPHQQHYAFFFIFPASTYMLFYVIAGGTNSGIKKSALKIFLCIVFLLCNSRLLLGTFNKYYDHYKTRTYGVLLLLIIMVCCPPKYMQDRKGI